MKNSFSQTGFAALGLIALAGAVVSAVYFSKPDKAGALFQPDNASVVAQGKEIYAANCASCHGDNLEGQPNWRSPDADGYLPAPPHDKSGHTWHHPDAMLFATTLTYAYMGATHMGININTVPIIAVGVGVGIDYSIYMMDRIRSEMVKLGDIAQAVRAAISTTGLAVSFTAITLIAGIVMWVLLSDLRFQADAALLLIVMVVLNGAAAMLLVPSWVLVFKPKFICNAYEDEDGVIHAT